MIREYCDTCGNEIKKSEFLPVEGESFNQWTTTRIQITVSSGPDRNHSSGNTFNESKDVLCPDCAKKWRYAG